MRQATHDCRMADRRRSRRKRRDSNTTPSSSPPQNASLSMKKVTTTLLLASSCITLVGSSGIPQHRVKTSTRLLDYGDVPHPLSRYTMAKNNDGDVEIISRKLEEKQTEEEDWIPFVDSSGGNVSKDTNRIDVEFDISKHLRSPGKESRSGGNLSREDGGDVSKIGNGARSVEAGSGIDGSTITTTTTTTSTEEIYTSVEHVWTTSVGIPTSSPHKYSDNSNIDSGNENVGDTTTQQRRGEGNENLKKLNFGTGSNDSTEEDFWRGETSSPLPPPQDDSGEQQQQRGVTEVEQEERTKEYVLWENEVVEDGSYVMGEDEAEEEETEEENGSLSENASNMSISGSMEDQELTPAGGAGETNEVEDEDRVTDLLVAENETTSMLGEETLQDNLSSQHHSYHDSDTVGGNNTRNSSYVDSVSTVESVSNTDSLYPELPSPHDDDNNNSTSESPDNTTNTATFSSMRIKAFLGEETGAGKFLTDEQKRVLLDEIIRPALENWSNALRVVPLKGSLTVDKGQLFDGVSCGPGIDSGLPSVLVPSEHMTEGVPDADLVLYLSLGFHSEDKNEMEMESGGSDLSDYKMKTSSYPLWEMQPTDESHPEPSSSYVDYADNNLSGSSVAFNESVSSQNNTSVRCRPVTHPNSSSSLVASNETNTTGMDSNNTNATNSSMLSGSNSSISTEEEDHFNLTFDANATSKNSSTGEEGEDSNSTVNDNTTFTNSAAEISHESNSSGVEDTNLTKSNNTTTNPTSALNYNTSHGNQSNSSITTLPTEAPGYNSTVGQEITSTADPTAVTNPTLLPNSNSSIGNTTSPTKAPDSNSSWSEEEINSITSNNSTTDPTVAPDGSDSNSSTTVVTSTTDPTTSFAQEVSSVTSEKNETTGSTTMPSTATLSSTTTSAPDINSSTVHESNETTTDSTVVSTASAYSTVAPESRSSSTGGSSPIIFNDTLTTQPTVSASSNSSQNEKLNSSTTANNTTTNPTQMPDSNSSITQDANTTAAPSNATTQVTPVPDNNSSISDDYNSSEVNNIVTNQSLTSDSNSSSASNSSIVQHPNSSSTVDSNSTTAKNITADPTQTPGSNSSIAQDAYATTAPSNTATQATSVSNYDYNSSILDDYNSSESDNATTNQSLASDFNSSSASNSSIVQNPQNSSSTEDSNSITDVDDQEDMDLPPCEDVAMDEPSSPPSSLPSLSPSLSPSSLPSVYPSLEPSSQPSVTPSSAPTEEQPPECLGDYLASATYCSTDQFDRPVAGMMHICIGDDFFLAENRQKNIITVMHEIGHVLGFNALSLAHFRARDGTPLTPRDKNGDVPDKGVECTGPAEGRFRDTIPLPSESILKFRETRGGVRVADVVTPTVAQVVRNQFDCQQLAGGELESPHNYGEDGENDVDRDCIGGHWGRRLFPTDLMNPDVGSVEYTTNISPLTLALMADSGWYQVELARAAFVSTWGRRAGCQFVDEKCVMDNGGVTRLNAPFFCNDVLSSGPGQAINEIHGCTADLSKKAVCSIVRYDNDLPKEFEYFGNVYGMGPQVGGSDPGLDFCPVFSGFSNGQCKEGGNAKLLEVHDMEEFGVKNSRCVVGEIDNTRTALCLQIACVISDRTLRIKVDGKWNVCDFEGQHISTWWERRDFIVCPDPSRVCPTFFCPRNCLGTNGGICDYTTGKCMCDSTNTREGNMDENGEVSNILVPCDENNPNNWHFKGSVENDVSRLESHLSEYYVKNSKVLKNNGKDIFDEVSRVFDKMSTGDTIAFVASCVVAFFFISFFTWRMRRACKKWVSILTPFIHRLIRKQICDQETPQDNNHHSPRRNNQKDKMVASLVVNLRVNDPVVLERFRRDRMRARSNRGARSKKELHSTKGEIVFQSELPPLPEDGGRVIAVVGSEFVQDGAGPQQNVSDDVSVGGTVATITTTAASVIGSTDDESVAQYRELCFDLEEHTPQIFDLRKRSRNVRDHVSEPNPFLNGIGKTTGL